MNETKGTSQTRARHSARGVTASASKPEGDAQSTAAAGRTSADYVQMLRFPVLVGLGGFAVALTLMALWPRSSGPQTFNASAYGQLPWPVGSGSPPVAGAPGVSGAATGAATATGVGPSGGVSVSGGASGVMGASPSSGVSGVRPSQPGVTAPPPGAGAPPAKQTTFSAVAGPGCTSGSDASFEAVGYWTGGEEIGRAHV